MAGKQFKLFWPTQVRKGPASKLSARSFQHPPVGPPKTERRCPQKPWSLPAQGSVAAWAHGLLALDEAELKPRAGHLVDRQTCGFFFFPPPSFPPSKKREERANIEEKVKVNYTKEETLCGVDNKISRTTGSLGFLFAPGHKSTCSLPQFLDIVLGRPLETSLN